MAGAESSVWPVALAGLGAAGVGLYLLNRHERGTAAPASKPDRPITAAAVSTAASDPASSTAAPIAIPAAPITIPAEVAAVLPWPLSRFGGAAPAAVPPVQVAPSPRAPSPGPTVGELPTAAAPAVTAPDGWAGWVWPLPRWRDYAPRVSDGFGSPRDNRTRRHLGADIMFRRRSASDQAGTFPPRRPYSRWHFVPPGTPALAMGPGVVVRAERTARGGTIVIRHSSPDVATYYTHLGEMFVRVGQTVRAGQPIGVVSSDPSGPKIDHLHLEIWPGGLRSRVINPEPILRRLPVVGAPEVPPSPPPAPSAPTTGPEAIAKLEEIVTAFGRGIPAEYLMALAKAESGPTLDAARGVLQITDTALADYNRRNPAAPITADRLRDPVVSVRVAVDTLLAIIASYREHHGNVDGMREDWQNQIFVELLTAGWNAGHSQAAGVGRVVRYLRQSGRPITLDAVWRHAQDAGATAHLRNPAKLAFARAVAADYMRRVSAGGGGL